MIGEQGLTQRRHGLFLAALLAWPAVYTLVAPAWRFAWPRLLGC